VKRLLVVIGLVGGMLLLTPGAALACSCATSSVAQQVRSAETIVDADLDWKATNGVETTYGIKVRTVFKGKAAQDEKLLSNLNEASCGLGDLATKERYLFFVDGEHPGQLKAGLCGGTTGYTPALAAQIEKITGAPTGPYVTPPTKPGPSDQDPIAGTSIWTILGTTAVIVVVLGGLMYLRKRA
jgi:hypothetical protein